MRRIIFGLLILMGTLHLPVRAQQWTGTAALGLTGGHQTNAYLDPVLGTWDPTSSPPFLALTPQVGLVRSTRRTRFDLTGRGRLYPRRSDMPQFLQGNARFQYRLSPTWTLGARGGGTRYRFASARDSWWALPSVRWDATQHASVSLQGGITERYVRTARGTDRQPSGVVALTVGSWIGERVYTKGRLYWSTGRTSVADAQFGGTGTALRATVWPTADWSVEVMTAAELLQYQTTTSTTVRDRIGRGGVKTTWDLRPSITLFAESQALVARLAQADGLHTDLHVSAGLRVRVQRVLGGTADAPPQRRVCKSVDAGVRIEIPYEGDGQPHVTGDFTDWSLPGIAMHKTDDNVWTATLAVPSDSYAYRIRIVNDTERRWLDLPSYAPTREDAFGGTNGLCTVH